MLKAGCGCGTTVQLLIMLGMTTAFMMVIITLQYTFYKLELYFYRLWYFLIEKNWRKNIINNFDIFYQMLNV